MFTRTGIILLLLYLAPTQGLPHVTRRFKLSGSWLLIGSNETVPVFSESSGLDSYSAQWVTGKIGNPLVDQNDLDYRYIGRENWTYVHQFKLPQGYGDPTSIELLWDGIDTFCDVSLNNFHLGSVNNSFLSVEWNVKDHIKADQLNELRLSCNSTISSANSLAELRSQSGLPDIPPDCWPSNFRGECHINLVRTTQASFGWDWGPAFPIQGFWHLPQLLFSYAPIRLGEGFKFYSKPSRLNGRTSYTTWDARATIEIVPTETNKVQQVQSFCLSFTIEKSVEFGTAEKCFFNETIQKARDFSAILFNNQKGIQPWWPNGIETGPRTYTLHVELKTLEGHVIDGAKHLIGFREVKLVEEWVRPEAPNLGRSFYFQVNGLPVFAKGANWIPSRLLPGRDVGFMHNSTSDALWAEKRVLRSAAMSGINMIRIWGGGRYEPEEFYEEADKLGLMIWHDMMFAVSTYPARESVDVLDSVEQEIRRQIRRLHAHPSIIVWATDNEVKQGIFAGWYVAPTNLLMAFKDRFVDSVAKVINEEEHVDDHLFTEDSGYLPRRCLISSPGNGIVTEQQHGFDGDPQDERFGDVHFYSYSDILWSETAYPVTRFTSEFGIQSLPSPLAWYRSLSDPTNQENWDVRGRLMQTRQHHALGLQFLNMAADVIGTPNGVSDMVVNYARWAYVTQLYQLMSYRAHINRLMRHQCRLARSTLHPVVPSSMGAAYWQLNDVWSAPTWSTIDAAGQWKMAHYGAVRDCYANHPLGRIAIHSDGTEVEADWIPYTSTDRHTTDLPDYFLLRCFSTRKFGPHRQGRINVDWKRKNTSCPVRVIKVPNQRIIEWCGWKHTDRYFDRLVQVDIVKNGAIRKGGGFALLDLPIMLYWNSPDRQHEVNVTNFFKVTLDSLSAQAPFRPTHAFKLTIVTKHPELYVWLDLDPKLNMEHWYDQNAFNMLDWNTKRINLYVVNTGNVSKAEIRGAIRVITLSSLRV